MTQQNETVRRRGFLQSVPGQVSRDGRNVERGRYRLPTACRFCIYVTSVIDQTVPLTIVTEHEKPTAAEARTA